VVEDAHRDLEALPLLAEQIRRGHAHVVEEHRRRVRRSDAHLVLVRPLVTPPRSRVTAKALIFPFCVTVSGVVLAKTVKKSAIPPFVIHSFCPLRT